MYLLGILYDVTNFLSAIFFFVAPTSFLLVSLLLLYWWFATRSCLDLFADFGRRLRIRGKNIEDLIENCQCGGTCKMGAVRVLQRK